MALALCLAIVAGTILGALLYGHVQARQRSMSEWAIGGRRFGVWIFWFADADKGIGRPGLFRKVLGRFGN